MRKCLLYFLPLVIVLFGRRLGLHAQVPAQFGFSKELRFAQYLEDKDANREAMRVLEQLVSDTTGLETGQKDSLFYLLGWAAYSGKQLDKSIDYLLRVSPGFSLYRKSRFFSAYNEAYLGRTDTALALLGQLPRADSVQEELRFLQSGGIALLKREYGEYGRQRSHFTYSSYVFSKEEHRMNEYASKMSAFKYKSPFLAGLYSALVPGLGKVYAGKKKQGIAAFLPVLCMAALTYEAYRKDGVKSARFIGFGSLFSIFYIGDIWGSSLAVKIKRNEFFKEYDNKILFDLHIPLRNFFN
jgi:hypothetical protein